MNTRFELITAFSPQQCVTRLAAVSRGPQPDLIWQPWLDVESGAVLYEGTSGRFLVRRRVLGELFLRTCAVATIREVPTGSVITGKFSSHPGIEALRAVWLWGALFIGSLIFYGWVRDLASGLIRLKDSFDLPYSAEWVILAIFMFVMIAGHFGRGRTMSEDKLLKNFLAQTLYAREE